MMMKITMSLAALALGGGLTIGTAFAQHTGARSADDNGIPTAGQGQSSQPSQSSGPYDQSSGQPSGQPGAMYNEAPGMGAPDSQNAAAPGMGAPGGQDAVASCMMRFRSYNPATGTFVGFDGVRHPCP